MAIRFHSEDIAFRLKQQKTIALWIDQVINSYGSFSGNIQYIFCSDQYLLDLNKKHLQHDFYTDIITFNYNSGHIISGDIFISIERVLENAVIFHKTNEEELHRVMIHGTLHLLGFSDKTPKDQKKMRSLEEHSLLLLKRNVSHET